MAYLPPKPLNQYPWLMRLIFWFQKRKYGQILEPTLLWARTPKVFLKFLACFKALNRKSSPIDPLTRALVCIKISKINDCAFCIDLNSFLFLQAQGAADKIDALDDYLNSAKLTKKEKIIIHYAEMVTDSNQRVNIELIEKLKTYLSEDAIVELTALITFQNASSKFNAALGAKAFGFCEHSSQ